MKLFVLAALIALSACASPTLPTVAFVITYASGKVQQFYLEVVDALGFADDIAASAKALNGYK